jgi:uncharacterized protein YggU (UPF0235/DUF167 family)
MPPPEARLIVTVRPRAGHDAIVGWRNGALQVRVAAAPAGGAANEAVRALLAARLRCARGRVEIVRGHAARTKAVRVAGLTAAEVVARLGGSGGDDAPTGGAA